MEKRQNNKQQRHIERKEKSCKRVGKVLLFSAVLLGGLFLLDDQAIQASEADGKWAARSIEQIKKDVEGKREYTIVWGDTLSGISMATNITMDKLASLNGIGDYNLIYAGNKLVFEGNVVTVEDQNGMVTDQQSITEEDKVVPHQPIGESVAPSDSTSQETADAQQVPSSTNSSDETNTASGATEGNQTGSTGTNGTNDSGGAINPTPAPNPEPDPTPTPEPQVQYTVWFYVSEGGDTSINIERGTRLFATEAEATNFIDEYADNALLQGNSGSYGVMSWQ